MSEIYKDRMDEELSGVNCVNKLTNITTYFLKVYEIYRRLSNNYYTYWKQRHHTGMNITDFAIRDFSERQMNRKYCVVHGWYKSDSKVHLPVVLQTGNVTSRYVSIITFRVDSFPSDDTLSCKGRQLNLQAWSGRNRFPLKIGVKGKDEI